MEKGKVTITFNATIPTQDYGNIAPCITWEGEASPEDAQDILNTLRITVANLVLPMVDEFVKRQAKAGALTNVQIPDSFLGGLSGLYRWIRTTCPDIKIPALDEYLAVRNYKPRAAHPGNGSNGQPAPAQPTPPVEPVKELTPDEVTAELAKLGISDEPATPKKQPAKTGKKPGAGKLNQQRANRID
jgi:hypothetical protein